MTNQSAGPVGAGEPPVLVTDSAGDRTVTLNRPRSVNSVNLELKSALLAALAAAAAEPSVRADRDRLPSGQFAVAWPGGTDG